jgi:hypothetical protein
VAFAIVDRDRDGVEAVLMIVDDKADAETIAIELRSANVRVDVLQTTTESFRSLR